MLLAAAIVYVGLASFGIDYVTAASRQLRPLLICGTVFLLGFAITRILHAVHGILGG